MSVYSKIYEDKIKEVEQDFQNHSNNTSLIINNMFLKKYYFLISLCLQMF